MINTKRGITKKQNLKILSEIITENRNTNSSENEKNRSGKSLESYN